MAERPRNATIKRTTKETAIALSLGLDGEGRGAIRTGIPFFDHMLTLFSAHGGFDLTVRGRGDLKVDEHHLVEDVGICLGQAVDKALGDRRGIRRYGYALVPMDEALVEVAIDISGRAYCACTVVTTEKRIKDFNAQLVEDFFWGVARTLKASIHVHPRVRARNDHHLVEAAFKSFGQALGMAVERKGRIKGVPSTKGLL